MNSFDNLVKQGGVFLALSDGLVPEPTPTSPHIDPIPPSAQYPVASSLMLSSLAAASSLVNALMTDEVGVSHNDSLPSAIPITPSLTKHQDSSSLEQLIQKQREGLEAQRQGLEALLNQQKQLQEQKQKAIQNTPDKIGPAATTTTTSDSISPASALASSDFTRGANATEQHVAPHDGEHPIPLGEDQEQLSPATTNTTTTTTSDSMSEPNTGANATAQHVTQRDGEHTPTLEEDRRDDKQCSIRNNQAPDVQQLTMKALQLPELLRLVQTINARLVKMATSLCLAKTDLRYKEQYKDTNKIFVVRSINKRLIDYMLLQTLNLVKEN